MTIDMSQFYQVFFEESGEHLADMERMLLEVDIDNPDTEELNAIFRAAHSIKGGSGTFGFTDMTEVTHVLENLLDRLRKGEMAPRIEMIDAFLEAADVLKEQLSCHINGTVADTRPAEAVIEKLHALAAGDAAQVTESSPVAPSPVDTLASEPELAAEETSAPPPASTAIEQQSAARGAFRITFTPPAKFLKKPESLERLLEELSRLGELETLSASGSGEVDVKGKKKKKKKPEQQPRWEFRLSATEDEDAIRDIFAFIASPDRVSLEREQGAAAEAAASTVTAVEEDADYGFFTEPETATAEDEGYGFFGDIPAPPIEEEAGYGFFSEPPAPAQTSDTEETGYGFFQEVTPVPETAPAPAPAAPPSPPARRATDKPSASAASGESTSIRVGVEKVDQLINLVGELVITQAMLAQTTAGVDPILYESLHNGLAQLERNTRDLQESVMSIRMMPISFVFSRFPRVVRDLAGKLNKQVELVTVGENTELDKGLIEKIADPLTHLVRNSLDHGIESPEKRIAAGKPAKGTITLSASHQGGNIVIEVADNGAGLNRERILSKAMERGLNASESMPDNDVWMLIFEPGFSTAEVITDVSGRGVGMDVVKRNITEMGGVVNIESAAGVGTRMTIRLPLTLAILDGMSVSLGDSVYVVPLNLIVETLQPRPEDIKTVTGQGRMVHVRGEYLPIIALHSLFNMPTEITDPCQGVLVLIEAEGKKAALFVDALVGQQQVVIKSLESNFRKIVGVSGATIMGDGTVALILDVPMLIKLGQG